MLTFTLSYSQAIQFFQDKKYDSAMQDDKDFWWDENVPTCNNA
jgi:hypothetical protein